MENPGDLANLAPGAYEKLDNIIQDLLDKYKGGRPFFTALDDHIKDGTNEFMILDLAKGLENEFICSSGEFGDKLYELYKSGKLKCREVLIFGGKISTNKTGITPYYPTDFYLDEKEFVYLDDSYFSGRTVKTIDNYLDNFNSRIKEVRVVYDGSKEKLPYVKSIYRYYL
jgi:hypothetical protein